MVAALGWRSGCDAFAKPLIGIPLASRFGRAIDGRKSLRKSTSLVNFGAELFRDNKQIPTLYTPNVHVDVKISMFDGGGGGGDLD